MAKLVLYIGSLFNGSTAVHRLNAIKASGLEVIEIDSSIGANWPSMLFRFFRKCGFDIDFLGINRRVVEMCAKHRLDLLWVDKGWLLKRETILYLRRKYPNLKIIHYSPDDMFNPGNQTSIYLRAIPYYDSHITTKSFNVAELEAVGAKNVTFVFSAFDPLVHRPMNCDSPGHYHSDVSFVGDLELERAGSIEFLALNGIKVTVWTQSNWRRFFSPHENIIVKEGWFAEDEYARILSGSKIVLCFLRKANRDLHTTRSVEIPACGAFMLGERTTEHLEMFVEGKEAEFFSSNEELLQKVSFYLRRDEERKSIACSGRRRCLVSGYNNTSMVEKVLSTIM